MKRLIIFFVFILIFSQITYAYESSGKEYLKKGRNFLEQKKYSEAIEFLTKAANEFTLLEDYALLWLSDALHESGEHEKSLATIRLLLKKYPDSSLGKKARIREIKEAEEISDNDVQKLFESYLKDYQNDSDIKYLYARWLKKNDNPGSAKKIFKDLYISGNSYSDIAFSELQPCDLTSEDLFKRSKNLMNNYDYKSAERTLRMALAKSEGILRRQILTELGHSLFKQKRYSEAAEIYNQTQDKYWELRSRYRAREKETVLSSVDEMLNAGDRRIVSVLVAVASDKRREGDFAGAIELFRKIIDKYPSEREEAIWGIGWTYFLSGEYKKSSEIFKELFDKYNDSKYLYWYARSIDMSGENASDKYKRLVENKKDFYSLIAGRRMNSSINLIKSSETIKIKKPVISSKDYLSKKLDRIECLLELGFQKEAASEMLYISRKTNSTDDIYYICTKLNEIGYYNHSVRLASKMPEIQKMMEFLYPLAHWEIVERFSDKYNLDPLLILAVVREESRFDSDARSPAGALGLMQLMPSTAFRFDKKLKIGIRNSHDILNVRNNLNIGIYYLSNLIKDFDSFAPAIASYNAGEDIVRKWLKEGRYKSADEFIEDIPYQETRNYVKKVLSSYFEYKRIFSSDDLMSGIPIEKL
jgi:soluble lytic murein transglycosylase